MSSDPTVFHYPNAGKFVVPAPTPPGAGADLLARLLECVGRYGMNCAETKQLAPRYELTEAANVIGAELGRLAAEVERLREQRDTAESNYRFMVERAANEKLDGYRELAGQVASALEERDTARAEVERTTGPGTPSYRLNWLLEELAKRFPDVSSLSAEGPETRYLAEIDKLDLTVTETIRAYPTSDCHLCGQQGIETLLADGSPWYPMPMNGESNG